MPAITKYGSNALAQFLDAPDAVYGTGDDGSVTFDGSSTVLSIAPASSVYALTRDIYCYNMTVSNSVRIQPNGYRIFVKNLLTLGDASVIGWASNTGYATTGTIQQGGASGTSVTHSLGGNGDSGANSATAPTDAMGGTNYYKQPLQAVKGYAVTASGGPTYLRGGAGGSSGLGGGVIICAARYIACSATSTNAIFRAEGGAANAGGGVILIISSGGSLPSNVSTSVAGHGTGGSGTVNYMQLV